MVSKFLFILRNIPEISLKNLATKLANGFGRWKTQTQVPVSPELVTTLITRLLAIWGSPLFLSNFVLPKILSQKSSCQKWHQNSYDLEKVCLKQIGILDGTKGFKISNLLLLDSENCKGEFGSLLCFFCLLKMSFLMLLIFWQTVMK